MQKVALIGVPLDLGAENLGVSMGADTFRYQHILQKLTDAGLDVTDKGNVACKDRKEAAEGNPRLRYADEIIRVSEETAKLTEATIKAGQKAIVLGGDHSVVLGAVAGASAALYGNIGVIYFDAHGDMNTDKTTLTGNIHGMHLASLMGLGAPELARVHSPRVKLDKKNLLHIGGSDFDQAELDLIKKQGLTTFTMFDVLTKGLGDLLPMIDQLCSQVDHIWVSLDLDAIDSLYAPGAGMPNQKGLTYREIALIAGYVGKKRQVVGIDVVEYNPLQDEQSKTAELAIELIATFLNKQYSWYSHYMAANRC